MRAIAIERFGGPNELKAMDLPRPRADRGEVLLRVVSAGVNPVDAMICAGGFDGLMPHDFPLIPGWDVAGSVEELGEGVSSVRKGDRVWALARKASIQWGCYAEYVAVPESSLAPMPAKLLFEEAAAMPLAGLTAYQCLSAMGGIGGGSRVLIHGAGGGVGHLAVQLARHAGAAVYATTGSDKLDFVFGLGAAGVIDYSREDFREAMGRLCPEGVDLVVDLVGGDVTAHSLEVLREDGRLISTVEEPDAEAAHKRGVRTRFLWAEADGEQLTHLAQLVDEKVLRPHVEKIYSLNDAAEAHRRVREGHTRGKLVLNL
ncbi:MAG: NADP-dependent oxidoreductase [bacterium]|nr:NADP-dependent oxidoreductase [bacterium]